MERSLEVPTATSFREVPAKLLEINRLSRKQEEAPAAPPADVALLTEIRDLLKEKR